MMPWRSIRNVAMLWGVVAAITLMAVALATENNTLGWVLAAIVVGVTLVVLASFSYELWKMGKDQ